jgi:hypothetical protein
VKTAIEAEPVCEQGTQPHALPVSHHNILIFRCFFIFFIALAHDAKNARGILIAALNQTF